MAWAAESTNATYTLYGFNNDLDWRETCFLEPLPPSRYCAYCARVCATMMMLPCCHIVCTGCYSQCRTSGNACVLDAQRFLRHDVAVMAYTNEDLASKHIRCWNADRGCDITGPLFRIFEHYRRDCEYHAISCPRCGKAVSHGDVVPHLAQECSPSTSLGHLPPQIAQAALVGAEIANIQLEAQNSAASRIPGTADQNLSRRHQERADFVRREVAPDPLENVLEPCHQETHISRTFQPGKAGGQDELSSSQRGAQAAVDESCEAAPVLVSGVHKQVPSPAHPKSEENKLFSTHRKNTMVAIKKACAYLEDVMKERLEDLCSLAEPTTTTLQDDSVKSSGIASPIPETAQQGSTQYPDSGATHAVDTLSALQLQGPSALMAKVVSSKTATVPEDLASSGAEKPTTAAAERGKTDEVGMCDPVKGQPAMGDSAAPSHADLESDFSPQCGPEGNGKQARTSVVSMPATLTSASANPADEELLLLLSSYLNSCGRFLENLFGGIDDIKDALDKHEPENLAYVLKACEEARAQIKEECLASGAMRNQIQQKVTNFLHTVQRQVHILSGEDLFQDPVGKKIDRLLNMGKHILRERIGESVPVQWYVDRWSELKAKAVATGKAADYFSSIRRTFFGYVIVPGLLLEKTPNKLVLRFSFYVRKGDFDDFLDWPIEKEFTLTILHPTDKGQTRCLVVDTRSGHKERYTRPGNAARDPVWSNKCLKVNPLDASGYVEGDRLLLRFEVK